MRRWKAEYDGNHHAVEIIDGENEAHVRRQVVDLNKKKGKRIDGAIDVVPFPRVFKSVKIDNSGHWSDSVTKHGKVIETYAYDDTERCHLCEALPSFYLIHLGACLEPYSEMQDELYQSVSEMIDEAVAQLGYENDIYMHCSDVEPLNPEIIEGFEDTGDERMKNSDSLREAFHSNPW